MRRRILSLLLALALLVGLIPIGVSTAHADSVPSVTVTGLEDDTPLSFAKEGDKRKLSDLTAVTKFESSGCGMCPSDTCFQNDIADGYTITYPYGAKGVRITLTDAGTLYRSNGRVYSEFDASKKQLSWRVPVLTDPTDYYILASYEDDCFYAIYFKAGEPNQEDAKEKLDTAEKAISGTYYPAFGEDTNGLDMIRDRLKAAGITDVEVSLDGAIYSADRTTGIQEDGTLKYRQRESDTVEPAAVEILPKVILKFEGYTRITENCRFSFGTDYQAILNAALTEYGLRNFNTGEKINEANVASDIQFPTTKNLNAIAYRDYEKSFDGKYTPILLCTSDGNVIISADPTVANVARMITYRPLPGEEAKTITVTVKILSRPLGEGKDYENMPVLASKDITLTVQPLTQEELDEAAAFMTKVCTEDVYWEGIRKANSDKEHVTGDLWSFIEVVPDGDGYKFIRNMDDYNFLGVKADDIPGWYDAQQYRCFRSSDNSVIAHENLLLTQPKYNTTVTIDSVLTYTEYAKYYEKFGSDPAYAQFAKFYQQPISAAVTVIGTEGIEDPDLHEMNVKISVEGSTRNSDFADLEEALYTCSTGDHKTAADAVIDALTKNGYTYKGTPNYISDITDPKGTAMEAGDLGPCSGWMYSVNGKVLSETVLSAYVLQENDVIRMFYVACPTDTGDHIWSTEGEITKQPTCKEEGGMTYTCTVCKATKTEPIAKLAHTWNGGKVTKEATTFAEGEKLYTCTVCGATRTEILAKLAPCDGGQKCPGRKFSDVNTAKWYHEAVDYTVVKGLFDGTSPSTFEPNTAMTRAMLVTVLYRMEEEPKSEAKNPFSDVKAGKWYTDAVVWAAENGIVNGIGDGKFDPSGMITREQMATMLYRYAAFKGVDVSGRGDLGAFPDASKVSAYAQDAMSWAVANGIIGGTREGGKDYLDPKGDATRAQTAAILMRYAKAFG